MKIPSLCRILLLALFILQSGVFAQSTQELVKLSKLNSNSSFDSIPDVVIDANYELIEALAGLNIPEIVKNKLELVSVYYYGFDDRIHKGQVIVNKEVVQDIIEIFDFIRETKFPIKKVVPICEYKWSDEESMKDNNTSSFNYRFISGTRIHSMHASGLAIDINPFLNPYIKNHVILPEGATYNTTQRGTLTANSPLVKEFKKRGWTWGGDWKSLKDYQHFEKKINSDSKSGK
ncbi:MAG: M15 family metallopeptidase [Ignavibacteria bacterium]|nr:M15 family metallopeptidase [Ignavibacteria bacterium]MBT8383432.1 M15 family metallopeptidase [Ignavibacteria bacterium]MBT8390723.1 M15 family metallopeptidase [Ignavibacteria bacterium]NNJ53654.1 M15 family metallopeptidase [Ignavibacteriaceae bacterium]NNL22526.1 M15 family metallopeptidase [Ignavibacteriaceae bacterium]